MEIEVAFEILKRFLEKRGVSQLKDLAGLVALGKAKGFFKDPEGLFEVDEWRAYGDYLWDLVIDDDKSAKKLMKSQREEVWPAPPTPPLMGEDTCCPPPTAPPVYPPLPPSEDSLGASTPPFVSEEKTVTNTNELLKEVVQQLRDLTVNVQKGSLTKKQAGLGESPPPCLSGPPALTRPGRWSGVVRDAILEGQRGVASNLGPTTFPVIQENGHAKWESHDWKILQQAKNTISQYGVT